MKYRTLKQFKEAIDDGAIPPDSTIILDNDSSYATVPHSITPVDFNSDPHTLLREALDLLGIQHDEC